MQRIKSIFIPALVLMAMTSCRATIRPHHPVRPSFVMSIPVSAHTSAPPPAYAPPPGPGPAPVGYVTTGGGYGPGEDAHWMQPDDYFISDRPYTKGWMWVRLAKMKQAPAPATRGEGLFFLLHDGRDEWSGNFYRTRPAVPGDLTVGNVLLCFHGNERGGVHQMPKSKDNARRGSWWMARLTDLSDMYKGYATMAGGYHCTPEAMRALVQ